MSKLEKELNDLIRLGKKTGNMKLKNYARKALFGLMSDDGTQGLGDYLWKEEIRPNLIVAREIARYVQQNKSVVNFASILSKRHLLSDWAWK